MQIPSRPTSNITDAMGNITPAWNSYFTAIERAIYKPLHGATASRPTTGVDIGDSYFDDTLGYPIFAASIDPIVWHDAAGNVV